MLKAAISFFFALILFTLRSALRQLLAVFKGDGDDLYPAFPRNARSQVHP